MRIVAAGGENEFTNNYIVNANRDGVLLFESCAIDDGLFTGSIWKTTAPSGGGTPVLRLNQDFDIGQITALSGEFQINAGGLNVVKATTTSGKSKHYGGGITTGSEGTITFSDAFSDDSTCPGDPCQ